MSNRELSTELMAALLDGGVLNKILIRVKFDKTLDLQIRSDEVHIYYRGCKLIGIKRFKNCYACTINDVYVCKYNEHELNTDCKINIDSYEMEITTKCENVSKLIANNILVLKQAIDFYLGVNSYGGELEFQQLIARENNYSAISNATDYFIVDIESKKNNVRFDMVAIKWESDGNARKYPSNINWRPKLAICELKYYTASTKGISGIVDHAEKLINFVSDIDALDKLKKEALKIFEQKRNLGLISFKGNPGVVENLADEVELIFMVANHDPESGMLAPLKEVKEKYPQFKVATANFLGCGLYKENIYSIVDFCEKFENQIWSQPAAMMGKGTEHGK